MQSTLRTAFTSLALACCLPLTVWAEQIVVPVGSQQGAHVNMPGKGVSMSQVISRYGEPEHKSGPVGQPPISTWEYPSFTVYFEHEHTIHSVVKHVPQPQTAPAAEPAEPSTDEDMEE
ncbi:MAG TPA: hypothetical protein PK129_03970 [Cellvibrionaceae bacterium]|nr:hypothetical protein [Cellvibrionaceae bacterium]